MPFTEKQLSLAREGTAGALESGPVALPPAHRIIPFPKPPDPTLRPGPAARKKPHWRPCSPLPRPFWSVPVPSPAQMAGSAGYDDRSTWGRVDVRRAAQVTCMRSSRSIHG